jgi:hypothetical protein
MAAWAGTISPDDGVTKGQLCAMSGNLLCAATGWKLAVTAVLNAGTIYLSGKFDSPTFADDAAPWTDEHKLAKPRVPLALEYG